MAQQGKRVLLIGCDPKSDTTSLLFGGRSCPTIIETSSAKKAAGEKVAIGDVCFKRDGVYAMELGGPEVGRGCGGRGIIHGFELLDKLGFHDWGFDYVLLDFLGDVVCGGFGLPIARDMCQKVIVVGSNDLQSLYVANNVCSAVEYFKRLGGNVGVAGLVLMLQKPGSAKGVMFLTLEDESGHANLIVWPSIFEQQRRLILSASMIACHGRLQREGGVTHVIAERLVDLSALLRTLGTGAGEFPHVTGRGDGARHGGSPDSREAGIGGRKIRDIYPAQFRPAVAKEIKVKTRDFR